MKPTAEPDFQAEAAEAARHIAHHLDLYTPLTCGQKLIDEMAAIILALCSRVREQTLEEAAKIAEHNIIPEIDPNDEGYNAGRRAAAAAIRAASRNEGGEKP